VRAGCLILPGWLVGVFVLPSPFNWYLTLALIVWLGTVLALAAARA
jgi:hypothetical protein